MLREYFIISKFLGRGAIAVPLQVSKVTKYMRTAVHFE